MSVLAVPLSLGEGPGRIEDAEALVRKVVRDRLTQWGARLDDWRREELVSYLLGVCWELSCRYDPEKDKNPNLAAYAARILSLRVADWYRQTFGDTRHGDRPVVLSLDAPLTLAGHSASGPGSFSLDENEGADRLVDTLRASTGDPAEDRSPDLVGILHGRSRPAAGPHAAVGEPQAGGAARRDRSSAAVKAVRSKTQPRIPGTRRAPSRPPLCEHCFVTFREAFRRVNEKTRPELQLSEAQIETKAQKRARAVKFGDEWACPRCTKLEDPAGQKLMLQSVYTNRAARRAAVGKGRVAKTGVAQHERKALQQARAHRQSTSKQKDTTKRRAK